MIYLRQSTASQSVLIGPFVDSTDGATAETGLTIANTDIRLSKNGGNIAAKNSGGGTHDEIGYYTITLDATDTDTVGRLQLMVNATGALAVYHEYQVLEEAVYDQLFAASALGYIANAPVNVAQISGDSTAADNAEAFFDGTGYAGTGNVIPTVTNVTGSIGSLGAQAKLDVNAEADTAISDAALATAENLATVDTVADAIKVQTDKLTFTVANVLDVNALRVNGSTEAAARLERAAESEILGTCGAGGTTTSIVASSLAPTSAVADQFNGRILIFAADTTTTALRGQATDITDYDHDTLTFTVTALTTAPSSGDTFVVV